LVFLSQVFNWASVFAGFAAAFLWYRASKVIIRQGDPRSKGGILTGVRGDPGGTPVDVYSTVIEGAKINQWAALITAATVLLQALSALVLKIS
jgi:hypothetical protein